MLPWGSDAEHARSRRIAAAIGRAIVPAAAVARRDWPRCSRARDAVVGVDTGLTHLAAALGTPTLALFTATDPALAGVAIAGAHARDLGGNGVVPASTTRAQRSATLAASARRDADAQALHARCGALRAAARSRCGCGGAAAASRATASDIGERFGIYARRAGADGDVVWVHAVSVGEARAAAPLVARAARARVPARRSC